MGRKGEKVSFGKIWRPHRQVRFLYTGRYVTTSPPLPIGKQEYLILNYQECRK